MKVLELARQLAKSLSESPEYQAYQGAKTKLEAHEAARLMFEDFRKKQWEYERKRLNGDQLLEPLEAELRKLSEIIGLNPYIHDFVMAEYEFSKLMMEIQNIIGEAVGLERT